MKKNEQGPPITIGQQQHHHSTGTPSYKQALQSASSSNQQQSDSTNNNTTTTRSTHSSRQQQQHQPTTTTTHTTKHQQHHQHQPTTTTKSSHQPHHHHQQHHSTPSNTNTATITTITDVTPLLSIENTDVGNHVVLRLYPTSSTSQQQQGLLLEGEVFAIDSTLGILALFINEGKHASSTRKNFRVVNINQIEKVISNNKASARPSVNTTTTGTSDSATTTESHQQQGKFYDTVPFGDTSIPLPEIDADDIKRREENAIHVRRERLGSNVSSEAQALFDILSKTVPCSWKGKQILVMDSVLISPPYNTIESVTGGLGVGERSRVQNLLQIALEKIKSSNNKQ